MTTITQIRMISSHGTPITLTVNGDSSTEEIQKVLERADAIGQHYHAHGWQFGNGPAPASAPNASPRFAGFKCSYSVDDRGFPSWLEVDGVQCRRREKQGDVWYSKPLGNEQFDQIWKCPKGENPPPVHGL